MRATRGGCAPSDEAKTKLDAMASALKLTAQQLATIHDITCIGTYRAAVTAALASAAGQVLQVPFVIHHFNYISTTSK